MRTSYTVSGQSLATGCEDGHTCTRIAIRTGAGEICSDKHNGNNKRGRRCLVPFLLQAKADQVNSPFDGYAPLHHAVSLGRLDVTRFLSQVRADVNQDCGGYSRRCMPQPGFTSRHHPPAPGH